MRALPLWLAPDFSLGQLGAKVIRPAIRLANRKGSNMKFMGFNVLALLAAAVAVYIVGFIIYGLLLGPEVWLASQGITKEQMDAIGTSRLPFSPAMPIVTAVGMALLFQWANVSGVANGIKWGVLIAMTSAVPAIWYGWVYGIGPCSGALIDSAHLVAGHGVAGAILARWK
jgi:Protein of unknown function (DUF1761)